MENDDPPLLGSSSLPMDKSPRLSCFTCCCTSRGTDFSSSSCIDKRSGLQSCNLYSVCLQGPFTTMLRWQVGWLPQAILGFHGWCYMCQNAWKLQGAAFAVRLTRCFLSSCASLPPVTAAVCATNPLSTRKKWLLLYPPSFASLSMWSDVTGATCKTKAGKTECLLRAAVSRKHADPYVRIQSHFYIPKGGLEHDTVIT